MQSVILPGCDFYSEESIHHCPVKEMSRVLVLVDYEYCTKQTFCYLFDHGLSRDASGFQTSWDFFLYLRHDGVLNVFLN